SLLFLRLAALLASYALGASKLVIKRDGTVTLTTKDGEKYTVSQLAPGVAVVTSEKEPVVATARQLAPDELLLTTKDGRKLRLRRLAPDELLLTSSDGQKARARVLDPDTLEATSSDGQKARARLSPGKAEIESEDGAKATLRYDPEDKTEVELDESRLEITALLLLIALRLGSLESS
uniref:ZZ4 n=1 Tax=Escherichia coli TaxID=562 RepID=UPI003D81C574